MRAVFFHKGRSLQSLSDGELRELGSRMLGEVIQTWEINRNRAKAYDEAMERFWERSRLPYTPPPPMVGLMCDDQRRVLVGVARELRERHSRPREWAWRYA